MKDYEEKYKQALKRAKVYHTGGSISDAHITEIIFPELAEPDDERIRKGIIRNLQYLMDRSEGFVKEDLQERIAWLEKQGEQTTDKIEPKFKVGDWITDGYVGGLITSIENNYPCYKIADFMGGINTSIPFTLQDNYHLWTINDAKDGDVLCYHVSATAFSLIGIFKRVAPKDELYGGTYRNYAQYGGFGSIEKYTLQVALGNDELHHCGSIAYPATKEQRDLLFQKIKEAGYEWSDEKKEVKKIELKKLDAEKVIEWMKTLYNLWQRVTIDINELIDRFIKDFGI